ncbi:C2 domain-containing protein 5 [Armadillidium vulgare]|nr:C2 domain-containing protein 5 [Armadillidium vulgare]
MLFLLVNCIETCKNQVIENILNLNNNSYIGKIKLYKTFQRKVDDLELQDEPLQIRLMDYDTYSANDAIGKVYVDLNPLLLAPAQLPSAKANQEPPPNSAGVMSGWLPVYDTMHGIRGEVNILVKVDLFSDFNKFRQSSCGVQFFFSPEIPSGFRCNSIIGFVEELVVNDDPEYQWIDKIRTPRASNEARQTLFSKLSGELQRRIGLKVLEQGGNAVIGYRQCFDLEGESGIVVRGIGSIVSLARIYYDPSSLAVSSTHSPSPLREFANIEGTNQREILEDGSDLILDSLFVAIPNSNELLPLTSYFQSPSNHGSSLTLFDSPFTAQVNPSNVIVKSSTYQGYLSDSDPWINLIGIKKNKRSLSEGRPPFKKGNSLPCATLKLLPPLHTTQDITKPMSTLNIQNPKEVEAKSNRKSRNKKCSINSKLEEDVKGADKNSRKLEKYKQWKTSKKFFMKAKHIMSKKEQHEQCLKGNYHKQKHHVWPEYFSQCKYYFKHRNLLSWRKHYHLPWIHLVAAKKCDRHEEEKFDFDILNHPAEIVCNRIKNFDLLCPGARLSSSDPSLNQSVYLKNLIRSIFDPRLSNQYENADSVMYKEKIKNRDLPKHKFYLSDSNSSSTDVSQHKILKDQLPETILLEESNKLSLDSKVSCNSDTPTPSTITENVGSSRRGSAIKGSLLHVSPGSLPDIRLVPSSPKPSSKPISCPTGFNNMEVSLNSSNKLDSTKEPMSASNNNVNVKTKDDNPEVHKDVNTNSDEKLKNLSVPKKSQTPILNTNSSSLSLYSSSKSLNEKSMLTKEKCVKCKSSLVPQSDSLLIMPAECSLSPLTFPPCSSSVHSSFLSLHASHSLLEPSVEFSRSGLSPCTVSPKRGSRSRKISGSYSMSRSPQMQESGENVNLSQSPTNSMKIVSPSHTSGPFCNRRSSDSDISVTPKGGSLTGSGGSYGGKTGLQGSVGTCQKQLMSQESFDNLIYPFLTMKSFPPEFIVHIGGTVSARSVKLLDRGHLPEEVDSRDSWWAQLRTEIRSHASDEVCVLSATGTAAVINVSYQENETVTGIPPSKALKDTVSASYEKKDSEMSSSKNSIRDSQQQQNVVCRSHPNVMEDIGEGSGSFNSMGIKLPSQPSPRPGYSPCSMCHIPYMETSNPFNVKIIKCEVCRKGKVPDVLLTTLEIPAGLPVTGQGCLIQARVVRSKRDLKGELNAKEISDSLPFLEYELHKQLYQKIMMKGMNSLFGLRVRVTVGERHVVGVGTGTAVYLTALPPPPMPRVVVSGSGQEEKRKLDIQKKIQEAFERNRELHGLKWTDNSNIPPRPQCESKNSDTEDSEEELFEFDLSSGNKDTYVLDLDDLEDVEMLQLLLEGPSPLHCISVSTQIPPGFPLEQTVSNLQMFTKVWRSKVPPNLSRTLFSSYFDALFQSIYFKIRNLSPCILSGLKMDVDLPEDDEIQIIAVGMVLGQGQPPYINTSNGHLNKSQDTASETKSSKQDDGDLMFTMEGVKENEEKSSSVVSSTVTSQKVPAAMTQSCGGLPNSSLKSTSSTQSFHSAPSFPSVPSVASISSGSSSGRSSLKTRIKRGDKKIVSYHLPPKGDHFGVEITPLSFIPGARIERYLGNLNFFFIRESTSIKENGGLSGFMGSFVTEVLALVRAHVAAIGGNAMISYFLSECILLHNPHKNQGQCLINVGGDIVQVIYCNPLPVTQPPQEQNENNTQPQVSNVSDSRPTATNIV